jgi:hypothetical protein
VVWVEQPTQGSDTLLAMSRRAHDSARNSSRSRHLPSDPWMKWAGASLSASVIVWFRSPRSIRGRVIRSALAAALVFLALLGVFAAVVSATR